MSSLKVVQPRRRGPRYWRSLDELADTPRFRQFVEREFPAYADEMLAPASRRSFLKFMSASLALAGTTACRWPQEEILPFSHRPEGYVPGVPQHYATAIELGGAALGLLATSYDGRPIKIEGNPQHPMSLGGTHSQAQAAVLELYDPDRSERPVRREGGQAIAQRWEEFESFGREHFAALRERRGRGLRVLSEPSSSPSAADMRERLLAAFPEARWYEYEPISRDDQREGNALAFGRPLRAHLHLDRAEVIVSLDEDFLLRHPAAVRHARDFARARDPEAGGGNRLHVIETAYSVTGSMADQRLALAGESIPVVAACLAAELFLELGLELPSGSETMRRALERAQFHPIYTQLDFALARELLAHRGRSLLLAGPRQPPEVHALVALMNAALGNIGSTVSYTEDPAPSRPHHHVAIRELAGEIADGEVGTLLVLGGNPIFDAPADLEFAGLLGRVETTIRLGLYEDETSEACAWHLPRAHFLETWGDARAWDGTRTVTQPLIEPLLGGRSVIELLALVLDESSFRGYDVVRRTFSGGAAEFEASWRAALHDGLVADSAWPAVTPRVRGDWADRLKPHLVAPGERPEGEYELVFLEDPSLLDGRFANSGWLQELPDPLTKLTWDNAALLAPSTAAELGVKQGDVIRIRRDERDVELPVYVMPGQASGSIGVSVGYGRTRAGRVGSGVGVDVYPLRSGGAVGYARVRVEKTGRTYPLAATHDHFAVDRLGAEEAAERTHELVRDVERAEYLADPEGAMHRGHGFKPVDLWKPFEYDGHRWGMAIDLNACIGCNACTIACQAENNIPVVGKDEVLNGREMHWIRVDRYFSGESEAPEVSYQPVACQHCENAPCEPVCPVAATVHDHEGLNVMVYNRCVGTRYCANNCPYKVRRFNYFNNHKNESAIETMVYNPEVTVRSRGVMEKCTFCVQRINAVKIEAKNGRRAIRDGEIVPACAQACPTQAIAFGDLNDPESRVRAWHEHARSYAMLEELNVRPRTRYLARVRNRGAQSGSDHSGA